MHPKCRLLPRWYSKDIVWKLSYTVYHAYFHLPTPLQHIGYTDIHLHIHYIHNIPNPPASDVKKERSHMHNSKQSSVQFKMVSVRSEKPISAPPRLSEVSTMSPFKTVPMFVWLTMTLSRPLREDRLVHRLSTPLSSRRSMVWCPWLCECSWFNSIIGMMALALWMFMVQFNHWCDGLGFVNVHGSIQSMVWWPWLCECSWFNSVNGEMALWMFMVHFNHWCDSLGFVNVHGSF